METVLEKMIDEMPAGLDRAILRVLDFHVGRKNAISREQLLIDLTYLGFRFDDERDDDRELRICIHEMRKKGYEICSTGGINGGYWLGSDQEEVFDFTQSEYRSRAMDMLETAKAMEDAAEKKWGRYSPEKQLSMF